MPLLGVESAGALLAQTVSFAAGWSSADALRSRATHSAGVASSLPNLSVACELRLQGPHTAWRSCVAMEQVAMCTLASGTPVESGQALSLLLRLQLITALAQKFVVD